MPKDRQDSAGTGSASSAAGSSSSSASPSSASSASSSTSNVKTEDDKSTAKDSADPKTENLYTASVKKISAPINADHNQDLIDF